MSDIDYFEHDQWHPEGYKPTQMDVWRWVLLKKYILNPLRVWLGVPAILTNGLRTNGTFDRLVRAGYHPSEKSDHFWGSQICPWSTAAGDVQWDQAKAGKTYEDAMNAVVEIPHMVPPGQMIWEWQDGKKDWMHLSLPKWLVFGSILAGMMPEKTQMLIGDNGRYLDFIRAMGD